MKITNKRDNDVFILRKVLEEDGVTISVVFDKLPIGESLDIIADEIEIR